MAMMMFIAWGTVAEISKKLWEDRTEAELWKDFLENTCIKWLRKYLRYRQAMLERKGEGEAGTQGECPVQVNVLTLTATISPETPRVRVSGKESQSILTLCCHVYSFYPRPITVSWLKDSEVRDQDTVWSSITPNSDGTYYTLAYINICLEKKDG
ncbi:class I histocompatibility antigen, F10 alpha chain-like [Cuculus canorus]|uniref:class I histocompatibility antigen, F10 alpha chain-like n=1 Tax=Cuculus canorus TaxID=55661 RepID=UPI0023AA92FE|nr:class I histocompatibility antigen, F10 alpha chain-like [Cuculus canorus]